MSELQRRIISLLTMLMLVFGALGTMSGCKEKGPGEKVGEAVDEAAEDAGEAAEDAGEAVRDAAK